MIERDIHNRIVEEIARLERDEEMTVLYACESGSRAWGFASTDSDYDVRFVYLRRTPWYLGIERGRDVIERPLSDELDISGWDATKALTLFRRSNPPLLEWLQSPIVYGSASRFADRLRGLMPQYYSPIACMSHYLKMAEGNLREYLRGDEVWTKKYFYVLRPVLACLWLERGLGPVPTEFATLVEGVVTDARLRAEIDSLLAVKRAGGELSRGPRNAVISGFIEAEMARLSVSRQPPSQTRDPRLLDELFRETLVEVNGETIRRRSPDA